MLGEIAQQQRQIGKLIADDLPDLAGAQLRGVDTEQAIIQLEEVLDWYERENPEK